MKFTKVEGCGNHFILVDLLKEDHVHDNTSLNLSDVKSLCDPYTGIGADGVLVLRSIRPELIEETNAFYEMIVYNADGSLAEMCGNGLRCVVWYLHKHYNYCSLPDHQAALLTGAGALPVSVSASGLISVEMGWPLIATHLESECIEMFSNSRPDSEISSLGYYSLGNPHLVTFAREHFQRRHELGPEWERLPESGVNVSFARRETSTALTLHVFERGCGWTQGCGTGACATVYHGYQQGLFQMGDKVRVKLPGGELQIQITTTGLVMWGDAREIYRGELISAE